MKKGKRLFSLLMSAVLSFALLPISANAEDGERATPAAVITGTDKIEARDTVYLGQDGNTPIAWRVLDPKETNTGADGMFLITQYLFDVKGVDFQTDYDQTTTGDPYAPYYKVINGNIDITLLANEYQQSDAQAWCTQFYRDNLEDIEQGSLIAVNKTDDPYSIYDASSIDGNTGTGTDMLFFLSAEEANDYFSGNDDRVATPVGGAAAGYWWLRSSDLYDTRAAGVVLFNGKIDAYLVGAARAGRPACNFNLESVLFTSAATGGKSAGGVGQALTPYSYNGGSEANTEWKFTLKDSDRDDFSVVGTTAVSGNTLTVAYSGAETGTNEYISAVVMDSVGNITYYGRLANVTSESSESGTVMVTLPDGFDSSNDHLYIFNEQYNGNFRTDYASDFQPVSLTKNAYTITNSLTNITSNNTAAFRQMSDGSDYTATLSASGVYRLPDSITVTVGGTALNSGYTYNSTTGELTIPADSITGDIEITASGVENQEETPDTQFTATSDNGGTLSGVDTSMQYSVDGGNSWTAIQAADITDGSITLSNVTVTNGIWVKKLGDGTTTADSDIQTITVTQAAQPTGIGKVDCTTLDQNDGQITGVNNTMEYRLSTASDWTSITDDMLTEGSLTRLSDGTYDVRVKAAGTVLASTSVRVTIGAHTCTADGTGWHTSGTEHWHTCACGNIIDRASHTYDQQAAASAYLAAAATCTAQATYYNSCVCGRAGTVTFSSGATDPNNHTGTLEWTERTATTHTSRWNCCDTVAVNAELHKFESGVCADCAYVCQHSGGTNGYFTRAQCQYCGMEYGDYAEDMVSPTGEISIQQNRWNSFWNTVTLGLFFKETQEVTITGADDSEQAVGYDGTRHAVMVEYYLGDSLLSLDEVEALADTAWTAYGNSFNIDPDNTYVVYARITDHAGNATYISSDPLTLDGTAPAVTGITGGGVYCVEASFTVDEENLDSVRDGADILTADTQGRYTLGPGNHTVTITDKAGNETTLTVTVNAAHTPGTDDGDCTTAVTCTVCGEETTPAESGHNFTGVWQSNESGHWHVCQNAGCVQTETPAPHAGTDDGDCTTALLCDECRYEMIPASASHDWGAPSTAADEADRAAAPETGDNANIAIWLVLLFVSGASVTWVIYHQKRRRSAK